MINIFEFPLKTNPIKVKLLSDLLFIGVYQRIKQKFFCDNNMKILAILLHNKTKNVII